MIEIDSDSAPTRRRGEGRGGRFFVLGRAVWDALLTAPTGNRMNLILVFLVMAAGSGADQRLSKWSAQACETYLGMGKPRARHAIDELVTAGLVERTPDATPARPQYRLPDVAAEEDPIFLPVQLITGLAAETPMLRRVRETGDADALILLIDLYGQVQCDATHALPIACLSQHPAQPAHQVIERGVHTLWAVTPPQPGRMCAAGPWTRVQEDLDWDDFWIRIDLLRSIGAIRFEPWLFESDADDAEPLFPLDFTILTGADLTDDVSRLSATLIAAARELTRQQPQLPETYRDHHLIPRTAHQPAPAVVAVAKPRIEPDTPGARLSWRRRMELIEAQEAALSGLVRDLVGGVGSRPIGAPRPAPSQVLLSDELSEDLQEPGDELLGLD